jgi:hypothetical protein
MSQRHRLEPGGGGDPAICSVLGDRWDPSDLLGARRLPAIGVVLATLDLEAWRWRRTVVFDGPLVELG